MPRLSGARRDRRLRFQQQVGPAQDLKKPVPAEGYSRRRQLRLQHPVQLAAADPRLDLALPLNQLDDELCLHGLALSPLTLGVVVLTAHPQPPQDRNDGETLLSLLWLHLLL